MHDNRIEVAIVGGGQTGTPLLGQFLKNSDAIEVTGVADLDDGAPGMQIAKQNGINTTNNFLDLVQNEHLDIVIDVSGAPQVRTSLRKHMEVTGNRHTVVMNEMIVRLLMSMSTGSLVQQTERNRGY